MSCECLPTDTCRDGVLLPPGTDRVCDTCDAPARVLSACNQARCLNCAREGLPVSLPMPLPPRPMGWSGLYPVDPTPLDLAKAALDAGEPLRLLAYLEGPLAPNRTTYWRPPLPDVVAAALVVDSYAWSRPYRGATVTLDRSGAFVAAAASVSVANGLLEHTGVSADAKRPGYYRMINWPWTDPTLPSPLGNGEHGTLVWVPQPTAALLVELAAAGRWPDATLFDSWTGRATRLTKWAALLRDLRTYALTEHGRDSDQYADYKVAMGQCWALLLGASTPTGRKWKCAAHRPDWSHAVKTLASATLWRWADSCQQVCPKAPPVALRNIDELVLPASALRVVTSAARPGKRPPLQIDPLGTMLGSFKVKGAPCPAT